jgi:hypothetical protein
MRVGFRFTEEEREALHEALAALSAAERDCVLDGKGTPLWPRLAQAREIISHLMRMDLRTATAIRARIKPSDHILKDD